ncbi:MAG: CAP domain-containing protein [Deltaproteobacteria bacterium]|nr:CAP domain-containing protein [Deltaproteobacteria bacterium]
MPGVSEYNEPPGWFAVSDDERALSTVIEDLAAGISPDAVPEHDSALSAAARNLAWTVKKRGLDSLESVDHEEFQKVLVDMGVTDSAFRTVLFNVFRKRDVKGFLRDSLDRDFQTAQYTHYGVGAVQMWWPPTLVSAVILSRKPARFDPFPRTVDPGEEFFLQGDLLIRSRGYRVIVQGPKRADQFVPSVTAAGLFFQPLRLTEPGEHIVELTVETNQGPEVATLFTVRVTGESDMPPPIPVDRRVFTDGEAARNYLLDLVNAERRRVGVGPVSSSVDLTDMAQRYAEEMRRESLVAHVSPITGDCADRAEAAGIPFERITENIAVNQTVGDVHRSFMDSPAHRVNVLDPEVDFAGIGIAFGEDAKQVYVVENFIRYRNRRR